jgi:hypothetical protein
MPNDPLPGEGNPRSAITERLRIGAALWVIAGVMCAGLLVFVFVGEDLLAQNPGLAVLVLGGAIAALLTGGLLLARPGRGVVGLSNVVGVAWLLAFGSVAVRALDGPEGGPVLSSGLITAFGVAGALVTFRAGRSERRLD